ncbi:MAG: glutamine synthetase III [Clostridia bacterium]|nr:glutamine synthetase III [Clostridia bacterium]
MTNVSEIFGTMVFGDAEMKARLPEDIYLSIKKTIRDGRSLKLDVANVVANAMKEWAIEKGATHFTHWFQPMTGVTAEKHDSFISPCEEGKVLMEFSGKELVRGESDASSFPSGGLRATFEARGYTAWDPTSYAFVKDQVLYVPTAFCSWGGEALDEKTPLMRSMEALNKQALRVLHLFGNEDVTSIHTTVGPEQEYFLIDADMYSQRKDLMYTGRTLFGAKPSKGQELDDHYYGSIKPKVQAFMQELDEELWKLGVLAKTEHNEAAPAQHELAPIFSTANIATDHNQLTMEMMQKIARRHGMVCLLHEKPFEGVNGSGKHNNWALSTNTGVNLLEPGETPHENAQFLLFFCAVLKAVDEYQDLLRISAASAGNDHRLGGHEAPPNIISVFIGDELASILKSIEEETAYTAQEKTQMRIGVHVLPKFPKDTTDRNRTSPFAFTGNKFEFRMLGASASVAPPNVMLNTAVAEVLSEFADILEKSEDFQETLHQLIKTTITNHKRIIFNGNGYDTEWIKEAESRGLLNLPTTPDAYARFADAKNLALFTKHKVFNEQEITSRYRIGLGNYCKINLIEASTMVEMAKRELIPAICKYSKFLAESLYYKTQVSKHKSQKTYEKELMERLSLLCTDAFEKANEMEKAVQSIRAEKDVTWRASRVRDELCPAMEGLRAVIDEAETVTDRAFWPVPTYGDLLYGIC